MLNLYNIEKSNFVNGSGKRFVIWVQGCSLGCRGCWNQDSWSFEPNILKSCDEIFGEIVAQPHLDGVTFTGGEPFLQQIKLAKLAKMIKSKTNLNIQVFTGFRLEEIKDSPLLDEVDIVVAGRYGQKQRVYSFSDASWEFDNESVEILIERDGSLNITGYPQDEFLEELRR
jgi:anaerobic ribonucleoside-triphosphate reductase activating protein